ncbi:hypothetical protein NJB1728216S_49540 [Mycobacterium marinum]|nr:hypothetical protein NJB1907E8_50130 [Mycobacterium marinum]GJO08004.1 hypothetical protein NJB1907E90_22170 [Mycobacterium marinum]GJO08437.1 hypothetical protein NJB1907f34b_36500 [Mycobacterium marinum]GJO14039.1 hypothetical protein NJB1728e18_03750 [Mycobacterium marinum]GJO24643.1 hypothetical protein NJB1907E11_38310 [Mycobacterium marinum]
MGSMLLGVVVMLIWWAISPGFFRGRTLRRHSADLLLEPAVSPPAHLALPDSGDMQTVIAADLSNLPAGETAVNPQTGQHLTKDTSGAS